MKSETITTSTIRKDQIRAIHSRLPWQMKADKELKGDLIQQFTGDSERRSTTQMTVEEANQAIVSLYEGEDYFAYFDPKNKQHMAVLSLCHSLGWTKFDYVKKKLVPDLKTLGRFIINRSAAKKPLKLMTSVEVNQLVSQLQQILKKR